MIPYGRQWIDEEDIAAVCEVLRADYLTTGPKVEEFETRVADFVGARHAVAVCSGTAALHAAMFALGIGPGDEVIVPPLTFAATANCVVYQGGTPIFADVDPETLLLDPHRVEEKITGKTRAVIAVDFAGQPCDYDALRRVTTGHRLALVADGCHALGAEYQGRRVGSLADLTAFSFHPVKHITTGEGGMITTDNPEYAQRMRRFRNHGISADFRQRQAQGSWFYAMTELGYNYRLTDIQCALGLAQMAKLPRFLARRRQIAGAYDRALAGLTGVAPLAVHPDRIHAYHLYVIRLRPPLQRTVIFQALRQMEIGVNVHYIPVHLHPYYRERFGTGPGLCPAAEAAYEEIVSIPIFPAMSAAQVQQVVAALEETLSIGQDG